MLPEYQCHKRVRAAKIKDITMSARSPGAHLVRFEGGIEDQIVEDWWVKKHQPQSGGYYVVDDDGYQSFSPAVAFESGYSLIPSQAEKSATTAIVTQAAEPNGAEAKLTAEVGGTVLFYGSADDPGKVAKIIRVWNPGCVNLDNGATSVPVFGMRDEGKPLAFYAVLFKDERSDEELEVAYKPRIVMTRDGYAKQPI